MQSLNHIEQNPIDNQRLLNALESLSVSIGFVSTAVEMVRDALLTSPVVAACNCHVASEETIVDATQGKLDFDLG